MKICSVEGCTRKYSAIGFCHTHYVRFKKWGDPNILKKKHVRHDPICMINGCGRKHIACGYCRNHYQILFQKSQQLAFGRRIRKRYKNQLLQIYGNKCSCKNCPEGHESFLTLDHINGGGNIHRRNKSVYKVYREAIKEKDPSKYRILCHNCNWAIGVFGKCPHEIGNNDCIKL